MKINKIKINSFGKLRNKEIEFKNGINILYGENESGKSTIMNFIKILFMVFQKIKKEKKFQIMININHGEKKNFQENWNTL